VIGLHEWRAPIILQAKLRAGQGLMILGPVGTGKSSLAALLCGEVVKLGLTVAWEYTQSLLDSLFDGAGGTVARLKSPSLLVLDDFGLAQLSAYHIKELEKIVEMRYRNRRSTFVTGNFDLSALAQDQKLQRISDRWRQTNRPLWVEGPSRRKAEDG
jgi:DNA replication protein DnaC